MTDYQVRRWDAWHNHMALVMLGTLFLVKQKKSRAPTLADAVIQRFGSMWNQVGKYTRACHLSPFVLSLSMNGERWQAFLIEVE